MDPMAITKNSFKSQHPTTDFQCCHLNPIQNEILSLQQCKNHPPLLLVQTSSSNLSHTSFSKQQHSLRPWSTSSNYKNKGTSSIPISHHKHQQLLPTSHLKLYHRSKIKHKLHQTVRSLVSSIISHVSSSTLLTLRTDFLFFVWLTLFFVITSTPCPGACVPQASHNDFLGNVTNTGEWNEIYSGSSGGNDGDRSESGESTSALQNLLEHSVLNETLIENVYNARVVENDENINTKFSLDQSFSHNINRDTDIFRHNNNNDNVDDDDTVVTNNDSRLLNQVRGNDTVRRTKAYDSSIIIKSDTSSYYDPNDGKNSARSSSTGSSRSSSSIIILGNGALSGENYTQSSSSILNLRIRNGTQSTGMELMFSSEELEQFGTLFEGERAGEEVWRVRVNRNDNDRSILPWRNFSPYALSSSASLSLSSSSSQVFRRGGAMADWTAGRNIKGKENISHIEIDKEEFDSVKDFKERKSFHQPWNKSSLSLSILSYRAQGDEASSINFLADDAEEDSDNKTEKNEIKSYLKEYNGSRAFDGRIVNEIIVSKIDSKEENELQRKLKDTSSPLMLKTKDSSDSRSSQDNEYNKADDVIRFPSFEPNVSFISSGLPKTRSSLQIKRDLSRLIARPGFRINDEEKPHERLIVPTKCDRLFLSTPNGPRNGTFRSPSIAADDGHALQCIYYFVALPGEQVEIVFTNFNVRGTPPECVHEYVDIYTEVDKTDPKELINAPFSGRYCGRITPRRRISLFGGIALGYFTDVNEVEEGIFEGNYAFINSSRYSVGTPVPKTQCSYTIYGETKRQGDFLSPTYPGAYPKGLTCSYKFIGKPRQRIRLEFRDLDLFYGGTHCPFDYVKVYDGMGPSSPLIGTYCGQQRNLVIFSSEHLMLVTFTTLQRHTEAENRGFAAVWEFSESFVRLDFIRKNSATHVRGTECDQLILSQKRSSGSVYSPNYPFPYLPKIVCRYFIYGLQDAQNLERVRLSFEKFDVPTNWSSDEDSSVSSADQTQKCGEGYLKVYLKGQETMHAHDKYDHEFCGKDLPFDVVSDGPRLVLVFSSGETPGSGFKANYVFETEYRIPGTPAPDGSCHFTYYSSSETDGEFNSPRFPSNYPSSTNCTYIFYPKDNEQVRVVFDNFKLRADKFNGTGGAYGDECTEDWVEIWNVIENFEDRLVGRFCGLTAPGPIESMERAKALKVFLHTDDEAVYSGFKARYIFFTAKSIFGECGKNISMAQSGVLTSPNWPKNYDGPSIGSGSSTCNWFLSVRPGSRVMLHFEIFSVEGDPAARGCPAAAVRIWEDPDGIPQELCGENLLVDNSQFISTRDLMRVTFITADKAVGARGFKAVWTEVQLSSESTPCHHMYFRCVKSTFCIPIELRCDGVLNCGTAGEDIDDSDELLCDGGLEGDMSVMLMFIIAGAVAFTLICLLCLLGQKRRRQKRRRLQLRRPPIHVCDNAGARFAAMDSV